MSRFRFSLSNSQVRQEGVIDGPTFLDAVDNLWEHVDVSQGDVLEIGVLGFPPARYRCDAKLLTGKPMWSHAA
jgi:hypothetical protein